RAWTARGPAAGSLTIEYSGMRSRIEFRVALEVQPPKVANLVHVFTEAPKHPHAITPYIRRMIEATDKPPRLGPGVCLQIEEADVIQHVVVLAGNPPNDKQLVLVQHSGVPRSALGDGSGDGR